MWGHGILGDFRRGFFHEVLGYCIIHNLLIYIRSRSFLFLVRWLFRESKLRLSSLTRSFLHVGSPILSICTSIHFRSSSNSVFDKKEIIKIRKLKTNENHCNTESFQVVDMWIYSSCFFPRMINCHLQFFIELWWLYYLILTICNALVKFGGDQVLVLAIKVFNYIQHYWWP